MRMSPLSRCGIPLVALIALASCGGSTPTPQPATTRAASSTPVTGPTLNSGRVARSIEASIRIERHVRARVTCPGHVPQRQGWHFVCFARTTAGQTPFVVTEVNGSGQVRYVGK